MQKIQEQKKNESEYGAFNYTSIGDYQIGKHLGAGNYASVKQAIHKETGLITAIKIYEKSKLVDKQRKQAVLREITVLKKLQH